MMKIIKWISNIRKQYHKYLVDWNTGKVVKVKCKNHSYTWSGTIPCTGIYRCIHCGKSKRSLRRNICY